MNCESLLDHAPAFLDGTLAGPDREAIHRHLDACAGCRDLLAALARAPAEDEGFARAILARTSGSACGSARSRLCAFVDGELDAIDAGLVDGHLGHCSECLDLARVLRRMDTDLPFLAKIDPGPGFVEAVLARTTRRPRRVPLSDRWAAFVSSALERPRVAVEGAFIAVAVVAVPMAIDPAPLAHVPGAVNEIEASVRFGTRAVWATTESFVVEHSVAVASELSRRRTDTLETIRLRYGTFPASGASGDASDGTETPDRKPEAAEENRR